MIAEKTKNSPLSRLNTSSIGKKIIMALTGAALLGFVILHLLGNLQIFLGAEAINSYAELLEESGKLLWPARIILIMIFITHVSMAFSLRKTNQDAKPNKYQVDTVVQASSASLYMFETGLVILCFVIVHLLHFTFGILQPQYHEVLDSAGRDDVYLMVVSGFSNIYYVLGYCIAMSALGFHLSHAIASACQTLGLYHQHYTPKIKNISRAIGCSIALGYMIIPISVQLGILSLAK